GDLALSEERHCLPPRPRGGLVSGVRPETRKQARLGGCARARRRPEELRVWRWHHRWLRVGEESLGIASVVVGECLARGAELDEDAVGIHRVHRRAPTMVELSDIV